MPPLPRPRAVLFDLDGTLADTAPDLGGALNRVLRRHGRPALAPERIRPVVSHGGVALVRLGFGIEPDHPGFEDLRRELLETYRERICEHTRLFEGMDEVLARLEHDGIAWGVVTNKPGWLTLPLMRALGLDTRTRAIVGGDTCARRKPHPDPLLHACERLGVSPGACWYVGDAGRDMEAARAAGCLPIGATYGYLHPEDPPADWPSALDIDHPRALLTLLDGKVP